MDVDVLVDLEDVVRLDLGCQAIGNCGQKPFMEVVPGVVLLQIRVHAREWGWHGVGLGRNATNHASFGDPGVTRSIFE